MADQTGKGVVVLGIFAADLVFQAPRLPVIGETILGSGFSIGCGGKGSNQAVAARRSGARTTLITRIGNDLFGDMAMRLWQDEEIDTSHVVRAAEATGAAFIYLDEKTGDNAIIVAGGAAAGLTPAMMEEARATIAGSAVFVTQLEQPVETALKALALARHGGAVTILNPAPAPREPLPAEIWRSCDIVIPNETEASALTGIKVDSLESATAAAAKLLAFGCGAALITLGARGAVLHQSSGTTHIPARHFGDARDTTGAGDAFIGGFCAALVEGRDLVDAAHFASAVAGIAVTRLGAAAAIPHRPEVDAALRLREGRDRTTISRQGGRNGMP